MKNLHPPISCFISLFSVALTLTLTLTLTLKGQELQYLNTDLPVEVRVDDLVSRMTLEQKISQNQNAASAIPEPHPQISGSQPPFRSGKGNPARNQDNAHRNYESGVASAMLKKIGGYLYRHPPCDLTPIQYGPDLYDRIKIFFRL